VSQAEIKLGKPKVVGVDSQYSGLVVVHIPLEPKPDQHWAQIFNNVPPGATYGHATRLPQVVGGEVELRVPEDYVERSYETAKGFVTATNSYYAQNIEPELRRRQKAREDAEAERKRMMDEAQRRLDELEETSN